MFSWREKSSHTREIPHGFNVNSANSPMDSMLTVQIPPSTLICVGELFLPRAMQLDRLQFVPVLTSPRI